MLIPAQKNETILFNFDENLHFNKTNLLKFILYNSGNTLTISEFIEINYIQDKRNSLSKRSKLRYDLIRVIQAKLKQYEIKAELLNNKILFAFENLNKTSNLNLNINKKIEIINDQTDKNQFTLNIYEHIYLKNIRDSLIQLLNRYLHEINLLKQFEQKLIKN
jgi:hypothetical protein